MKVVQNSLMGTLNGITLASNLAYNETTWEPRGFRGDR
jgi:hypothetical protein